MFSKNPPTLKSMRNAYLAKFSAAGVLLLTLTTSCVTVNVNFPESAVQKATDDYVRDLYRAKEKGKNPVPEATGKTSSHFEMFTPTAGARETYSARSRGVAGAGDAVADTAPTLEFYSAHLSKANALSVGGDLSGDVGANSFAVSTIASIFNQLVPSAAADTEANIKVNSDKALKIKDRLASRVQEVIAQKRAGVLGETNDGLLELKGADKVKPLLKKKVEGIVTAENADRQELYAEVATANGIARGRIIDIQKSFARSFQAESPSGTWLQGADGKWAQKP